MVDYLTARHSLTLLNLISLFYTSEKPCSNCSVYVKKKSVNVV